MSPRIGLVAAALLAAGACAAAAGAGTDVAASDPAPRARPASAFGGLSAGTSGQGMVTGSREQSRPTRESSRETLAAATGTKAAARSQQGRQALGNAKELAGLAEKAAAKLADDAWQLPIERGVYRLTATFGQCSNLWSHCHTGLDFAAPSGTPIHAVAAAKVTGVGWAGAYGNRTVLTHEDGTESWYCHQSAIGVQVGDTVIPGAEIGRVGATGNTTGPHLHLEVRPGGGDAVDPKEALVFHDATP